MVVFLNSHAQVSHASPSRLSQLVRDTEQSTTLNEGDAFHGMPSFPEHISNLLFWPSIGMRTFYPGVKPRVR
jgi:hypothetical protein